MSEFSLETVREVWHDKDGWHIEVGQDRDSLGLVEIRYYESDAKNNCVARISFPIEAARLIAHAIALSADEVEILNRK